MADSERRDNNSAFDSDWFLVGEMCSSDSLVDLNAGFASITTMSYSRWSANSDFRLVVHDAAGCL